MLQNDNWVDGSFIFSIFYFFFFLSQFRLGSVTLEAVTEPADAVRQLLVHSLQRGNTLERHNQRLEEENLKLSQEQQRIASE